MFDTTCCHNLNIKMLMINAYKNTKRKPNIEYNSLYLRHKIASKNETE